MPLSRVRIRQAKRQVRVLGLAVAELGGCFLPLGVVYRGRLGAEGVVGCRPCGGDAAEAVSEAVRGSPHYGQVRVVLLDLSRLPGGCALDPFRLADLAGRPVLVLARIYSPWSSARHPGVHKGRGCRAGRKLGVESDERTTTGRGGFRFNITSSPSCT